MLLRQEMAVSSDAVGIETDLASGPGLRGITSEILKAKEAAPLTVRSQVGSQILTVNIKQGVYCLLLVFQNDYA